MSDIDTWHKPCLPFLSSCATFSFEEIVLFHICFIQAKTSILDDTFGERTETCLLLCSYCKMQR